MSSPGTSPGSPSSGVQFADDADVVGGAKLKKSASWTLSNDADGSSQPTTASTAATTADDDETTLAEEVKSKWRAQGPGRYVLAVGVLLASCAGFVNATAALVCGTLVSHVTGTTAKLGMALEGYSTGDGSESKTYQAMLLLASFLSGATVCGMLVSRNEVHFGTSAYGVALMLTSSLLLAAIFAFGCETPEDWPVYMASNWLAAYLQSMACGLQNGMCTAHFGAVVRTTHLTGLITDCGLTIGRLMSIVLRNRCQTRNFGPMDWAEFGVDVRKMGVFISLLFGYIGGVLVGATMADLLGIDALFIPASITGCGGIAYAIAKSKWTRAFEDAEADKLSRDLCEAEDLFEHVREQMDDWKGLKLKRAKSTLNMGELDNEVGTALDLLQDLESCLNEKLKKRHTFVVPRVPDADMIAAASETVEAGPVRAVSSPALLTADSEARKRKVSKERSLHALVEL
eukprot:TRINITY_DN2494_c1_g1_i1.p1 TRINITY_DN2494_c1_g1~~TRINITY_DN2494_c1_g1_i1.p1  ORF type:complete len:458 (+),score=96.23 TRINITY_DN2494_c1_g1_i1:118-1491(+)